MPAFVTGALIAGALAGTTFSIAAGLTLGFSWAAFGAALVLGAVSKAFAPKPKQAEFGAQGSLQTIRQPVAARQVIYGRRRVSGTITFLQVTAGHGTVRELPDIAITDGNGETIGWTDGGQTVEPGPANAHLHMVITWAGHPCDAIEEVYFDDELVVPAGGGLVSGRLSQSLEMHHSLGGESGQPLIALEQYSGGQWTNAHRQEGCCKTYFMLIHNPDKYPNGIPNITAVIRGVKDIYDPRTGETGWTNNAALVRAHYLTNAEIGLGADYDEEIDEDQLIAAANECDESITLADGTTEARYTINGAFTLDEAPEDVILRMDAACAGMTVHLGATWHINVGGYQAPTLTLDDDDLAGPLAIDPMISTRETCNGVRAKFVNKSDRWQPVDAPVLASDSALEEDNDEQHWRDLDLTPFVTSSGQAQRLQKIELLRTRQGLSVAAPFKLKALRARTAKTVALTIAKYGWTEKVFEVAGFSFIVEGADGGRGRAPRLAVQLGLRETAAAVYDWATSEEQEQDLAPNTDLPEIFTVGTPGEPTFSESQYETAAGGGVKSKLRVSWGRASDGMVEQYQLRYKPASAPEKDANYVHLAPTRDTAETLFDIEPGAYTFQVRSINTLGVRSEWVEGEHEVLGIDAAPADITGLSIQVAGGVALLRWTQHPDLFVQEGGLIEFRHQATLVADDAEWESSFSIGEAVPGTANQVTLPLKEGTYLARARAQTGRLAENPAKISTKQASVHAFADIILVQEDADFDGVHSNTAAPDGVLKLAGAGLFDDIADFDALADLDLYGGLETSGTYTFATGIDLEAIDNVRLTAHISGFISNLDDLLDSRAGNIDDWVDFDGTLGADADCWIECRETDEDPDVAVTWSDWKRLDAGEFNGRGFQFRAQLQTADNSYNVLIEELRVTAAQVP
jgi:hypothetical protein